MSVAPPIKTAFTDEEQQVYRSVSKSAICCLVFAVLGISAFISPVFAILPLIAICCGLAAVVAFRKFPNELVGRAANTVGLVIALASLIGSVSYHSYVYVTEVPEGYQRISFSELKPSKKVRYKFSPKALDFNGKKVFVKGYTRPGQKKTNLKNFILVGDFGSCCFGGTPEITDVIAISILTEDTVDYSFSLRRIGGEFKLYEDQANASIIEDKDVPNIYYQIQADYVK